MIICQKCGEVYDNHYNLDPNGYCPKKHCSGELADIDENMVVVCKKIWDKGYTTEFCCEGHYDDYGSLPYIVIAFNSDKFDIPWPKDTSAPPTINIETEGYYPLINAVHHYIPTHDVFSIDIDIDIENAMQVKFATREHEKIWNKCAETIKAILKLPICQNLDDKCIESYNIGLYQSTCGEVPRVKISIYFKCILQILEEMHPDLVSSDNDLLKLRSEQDLFILNMQYKMHYIRFLLEDYIPKLPNITESKGWRKSTKMESARYDNMVKCRNMPFSEYEEYFKKWLSM